MFVDGLQNTSISARRAILMGCKEAGRLFVGLILMCAVGGLALVLSDSLLGKVPGILFLLFLGTGASLLTGPITALLTLFDISNTQFYILWPALIIPYWACLGGVIGRFFHETLPGYGEDKVVRLSMTHLRWKIGGVAVLLAAITYPLGPIAGPTRTGSSRSMKNGVVNNLRQIAGAKQQLALDKKLTADYVPSESELAPYLGRQSSGLEPLGPERYVLNSIDTPPYAVLDSDWRIRRRGWREGHTIPKGTRFEIKQR